MHSLLLVFFACLLCFASCLGLAPVASYANTPAYLTAVQTNVQPFILLPFYVNVSGSLTIASATLNYHQSASPTISTCTSTNTNTPGANIWVINCPSFTYTTAGTYPAVLTVTDSASNVATFNVPVTATGLCNIVGGLPNPTFSLSTVPTSSSINVGQVVSLNITGPAGVWLQVYVNWGDNNSTSLSQVIAPQLLSHIYNQAGTYTVLVSICSQNTPVSIPYQCNGACATYISQTITVAAVKPVFITGPNLPDSISQYTQLGSTQLTVFDILPLTTATVNFDDGSTPVQVTCTTTTATNSFYHIVTCPAHTFHASGLINVTYTVGDGSTTNTLTVSLQVFNPPCATIGVERSATATAGVPFYVTIYPSNRNTAPYLVVYSFYNGSSQVTLNSQTLPLNVSNVYTYGASNGYLFTAQVCGGTTSCVATECGASISSLVISVVNAPPIIQTLTGVPAQQFYFTAVPSSQITFIAYSTVTSVTVTYPGQSALTCTLLSNNANTYVYTCAPSGVYLPVGYQTVVYKVTTGSTSAQYNATILITSPVTCITSSPAFGSEITGYALVNINLALSNINLAAGKYNIYVNWNDASTTQTLATATTASLQHAYTAAGVYNITLNGCGTNGAAGTCTSNGCANTTYTYRAVILPTPSPLFITSPHLPATVYVNQQLTVPAFLVRDPLGITSVNLYQNLTLVGACTTTAVPNEANTYSVACPSVTLNAVGIVTLSFTAADSHSSATETAQLNILPLPACGQFTAPQAVFAGTPVTVTFTPLAGLTYPIFFYEQFNSGAAVNINNGVTGTVTATYNPNAVANTQLLVQLTAGSGTYATPTQQCSSSHTFTYTVLTASTTTPTLTSAVPTPVFTFPYAAPGPLTATSTTVAYIIYPSAPAAACTVAVNTVTCPAPVVRPLPVPGTFPIGIRLINTTTGQVTVISSTATFNS